MHTTEEIAIQVSIKELPQMKVAAYRTVSSTPESDTISYMMELIQREKLRFQ